MIQQNIYLHNCGKNSTVTMSENKISVFFYSGAIHTFGISVVLE